MFRRHLKLLPLTSLALLVTGCVSGPDYRAPTLVVSANFVNAPTVPTVPTAAVDSASLAKFWHQFGDQGLDRLVLAALEANLDVRIAQSRLIEANALLLGAEADRMPSVGVDATVTQSLTPEWQQPNQSRNQRTNTAYAPAVIMNWELDLFGRNARASESAIAQVSAQTFSVGAAQAAVTAAVASNYLNLRGLQLRLTVAEESLSNQREALRLTEARFAAGRSSPLDVARARNLVASTAAIVPSLQAQTTRTVNRLATLTGLPLVNLSASLAERKALPSLPMTDLSKWPLGTPEALLRRRPDIQVAERQLASSYAEIGVAIADRFPRISLSGLLGLNSNRGASLFASRNDAYSLGVSMSWAAFDFGRVSARVEGAQARSQRSLLIYEQTVLSALEETENALSGYTRSAQQAAELFIAASSARQAADIARKRYAAGSTDQLTMLDAERQLLAARDQLAQAEVGTATALVDIYRAFGGGWGQNIGQFIAASRPAAND
jgi:outer membrane protein, multidrug efflux system